MFGHEGENYKRKEGVTAEWRRVQRDIPEDTLMLPKPQPNLAAMEEFTLITRRTSAKHTVLTSEETTPRLINLFQTLEGIERVTNMPDIRREESTPNGNIVAWDIRGLNWPNKQENVRSFLHNNNVV